MKNLIVNADDFAFTKSITDGILYCHENGLISSTTIMINSDHVDYSLNRANKFPHLEIGLHLNLSEGLPVSDEKVVKSLIDPDSGLFYKNPKKFIKRYLIGKIKKEHIYIELKNQIEKFLSYNLNIYHIDFHKHLHKFYPVFDIFIKLIKEYKIPFYRIPIENRKRLHKEEIELNSNFYANCKLKNIKQQYKFAGVKLTSTFNKKLFLKDILSLNGNINEFMCHPGFIDDELLKKSSLTYKREKELDLLTNPKIIRLIKNKFQVSNFMQIVNNR